MKNDVREEQKYWEKLEKKTTSDLVLAGHHLIMLDKDKLSVELHSGKTMHIQISEDKNDK